MPCCHTLDQTLLRTRHRLLTCWTMGPILPTLERDGVESERKTSLGGLLSNPVLRLKRTLRSRIARAFVALLSLITILQVISSYTLFRDLGYLTRPLWDSPDRPWNVVAHYAPPGDLSDATNRQAYCALHGWQARTSHDPPVKIIDAVLFSGELDLMEIRMREYARDVNQFLVVEATRTFSGDPKPAFFQQDRDRFESIVGASNISLHVVSNLVEGLPKGSFENENRMRTEMGDLLTRELKTNSARYDHLVLQTDVDEILSQQTLQLLRSCKGYPSPLHLNTRNYLYSFEHPLLDDGYWRPKVVTVAASPSEQASIGYTHGRGGDTLLEDAGWHCSWCFPRLSDFKRKMTGYSHNDRLKNQRLLEDGWLKQRVCRGEDPFNMWPVSRTAYARAEIRLTHTCLFRKPSRSATSSHDLADNASRGHSSTFLARSRRIPSVSRTCSRTAANI